MATEKQIAANKRNAARSTGPRTSEGKARSSMNALRHGLSYLGSQSNRMVADEASTVDFHNDLHRIRVERTERMAKLHDIMLASDPATIDGLTKAISGLSRYEGRVYATYYRLIR